MPPQESNKPEEKPKDEAPPKPIVLKDKDFDPAFEHLAAIEAHAMKFAGQPAMNPYVWVFENVSPLKHRFDNGDRSPDLLRKMLSLQKVEPKTKNVTPRNQVIKG